MGINKIMTNALKTRFAMTDDFQFTFSNQKFPLKTNTQMTPQDILDICIMNIDLPQLSADVQSILMGGEYRVVSSKFQPFTIALGFRDIYGLDLRNYFINIWAASQTMYFDEIKSGIKISSGKTSIFESNDCLITSVSQVQLDNSNSQIVEFTVEFTTPYFTNANIKDFGKNESKSMAAASIITSLASQI